MAVHTHGLQVTSGSWAFNKLALWTFILIALLGLLILSRQWHDLAPPGRVIPSSYIPNSNFRADALSRKSYCNNLMVQQA